MLIPGMHRSGTSATARVVGLLGARLPATLMPPAAGVNDAGFWESMEFYRFHDDLLEAAGSRWDDFARFNLDWLGSPAAQRFKTQAHALLDHEFGSASFFVLKDPRICRILPFWLDVLSAQAITPYCLMPLRHPLEVAASLHKGYGFGLDKCCALWLSHVLAAEADSRTSPRAFLSYGDLLADWRATMRKAASDLGITWPQLSADTEMEIDAFLQAGLRHHNHDSLGNADVGTGSALLDLAVAAYEALSVLVSADASQTQTALAQLDDIRAAFDRTCAALDTLLVEHAGAASDAQAQAPAATQVTASWLEEEAQRLRNHPLFDAHWYLAQLACPDTARADPLLHYLRLGSAMGCSPHPLFHGSWYLSQHQDVARSGLEPLLHYVLQGAAEGRDPHPLFRTDLYLSQCDDDVAAQEQPLVHYLTTGGADACGGRYRATHPLFDAHWYCTTYPWVADSGLTPLEHYLRLGAAQGLDPNADFDTAWYLAQAPQLDPARENPLVHALTAGRQLGLETTPEGSAVVLPLGGESTAPINTAVEHGSEPEPVAVVAHLHFVELLWELLLYLRQMPVAYRLYVSTGTEANRTAILSAAARALPGVPVHCRVTPNRGRDWGPLLVGFPAAWRHPYLCHVHGKRSAHFVFGEQWRRYLLDHLLGSPAVIASTLRLLEDDAALGLMFPETFPAVTEHHVWGGNRDNTRALLRRLALDASVVDTHPLLFPAGAMFWCRTAALRPLWQAGLRWQDFPAEPVAEDGTLMHALERALVFIVQSGGFQAQQVRLPRIHADIIFS